MELQDLYFNFDEWLEKCDKEPTNELKDQNGVNVTEEGNIGCSNCECSCYRRERKRKLQQEENFNSKKQKNDKQTFHCMYCNKEFEVYTKRNTHCFEEHGRDYVLLIAVIPGNSFDYKGEVIIKDCFKVFSEKEKRVNIQKLFKKIKKIGAFKQKEYSEFPFKLPRNTSGLELIAYDNESIAYIIEEVKKIDPTREVQFVKFHYDEQSKIYVRNVDLNN